MKNLKARFPLGTVVATPGALALFETLTEQKVKGATPVDLLARHVRGDWSEMNAEDRRANEDALKDGSRVFSAYSFNGAKFWVITEADRSATTILLPDEY